MYNVTLAISLLPSFEEAVIITFPAETAVTMPSLSTVAMFVSLLSHVRDLTVAFAGKTV